MNTEALGAAILAAIPRNVVPRVHEGQIPEGSEPKLPWVIASLRLPQVRERSLGATPIVTSAHLQLTVAAGTHTGVLQIVDDLMGIDQHRLTVPGWECGPILVHNVRRPEVDRSLTLTGTVAHAVFTVLEARLTVSAMPVVGA